MDKYIHFSTQEFLMDDHFLEWLRNDNPELDQLWLKWLSKHPEKMREVEDAKTIYSSLSFEPKAIPSAEVQSEWRQLRDSLAAVESNDTDTEEITQLKTGWIWKMAACIGLIAMLVFGRNYLNQRQLPSSSKIITYTAPIGKVSNLELEDGTTVKLNGGSKLSYPEHFEINSRIVSLVGVGFFEVAKNPDKPFQIRTGEVTTEVLGTSFSISAIADENEVKVEVIEGKVKVNAHKKNAVNHEVLLTKDEMAIIDNTTNGMQVLDFDPTTLEAWKNGVLYFGQLDFETLVNRMEDAYGVKFEISEGFQIDKNWRFSGKFENKKLDYILNAISYPKLFNYTIVGNKIIITP